MLRLADAWTWDFWLADDGRSYHLYFLKAPRHIGHPDQRHWNASIGHATSPDLADWTVVSDAITPSGGPAFDDIATWTGSVVRGRDGTWFMFYTGVGPADRAPRQRIGLATSADLHHWSKHPGSPVLESDSRWYERLPDALQPDEAWRDPWVLADPDGDGWHMLVTARACDGPADQRGVIGHARSDDLIHWQAQPPLSRPGEGFGYLEVPQVEVVGGRPVLVFSCLGAGLSDKRRKAGMPGGTWCLPCDSPLGPFDVKRAVRITDESLYSGRLVSDRTGRWTMLAFRNHGPDGRFIGELADPMPIGWATDGSALTLDVAEPMTDALPGRSSLPHSTGGFQMAQIVLNHVEKAYTGGVKAVDDLSLDVKDGEFMVFVGPSGCGKSTALRSIAGLEEITGGTISIGDRVVNDLPPKDRDIAMVFQNYALYPHMTVEQNLAFGLQLRKTPKDEIKRRVGRGRQDAGPGAVPQAQAGRAVRRAAAAGRDGPGHRPRAAGLLDGRAAVQPGRQAARVHAGLAQPAARAARRHHRVRDPRPGRGHDPGQPRLRAAGRAAAAGRHPADPVRGAGQPVRGRVHRLPRDELRHRGAGPRRRRGGHLRRLQAAGTRRGPGRPSPAWRTTSASRSSSASARRTSRTSASATPAAG